MTLRIAIFDDDSSLQEQWFGRLQRLDQGNVVPLKDFSLQIENLEKRRREARTKEGVESLNDLGIESSFDAIDILIVDFDLLQTTDLSGEDIAYLLRCYSTCGIVVALNRFGMKNFDLRLTGYPESFADLNIGSEFFDDPGIWVGKDWKEFRPWSWPNLPKLHEAFEQRVEDLKEQMNEQILTFLGLDTPKAGILPRATQEFIQARGRDPKETSFNDFVMHAEQGLKRRDADGPIEELKPRIAAARLHRWLECFVLGGQEVLVDAPHLVTRFPSMLDGSIEQQETWDRTAQIDSIDGLKRSKIRKFEFPRSHWLSRPAWYWSAVRSHKGIPEVADPWSVEKHEWVFCEDTSRFSARTEARDFLSDLPSSFARRYVKNIEGIDYHPSVRFSL